MKKRYIAMILMAIFLFSVVNAQSVPDPQLENIGGVNIEIPYGFHENKSLSKDYTATVHTNRTVDIHYRTYYDEYNETAEIIVTEFNSHADSDDSIEHLDAEEVTINGVNGKLANTTNGYIFDYVKNGQLVEIKSDDYELIGFFVYNQ